MWKSYFPEEAPISFSKWSFFGFPLALLIFLALWGILCLLYCSKGSARILSAYLDKAHLRIELDILGAYVFGTNKPLSYPISWQRKAAQHLCS
ncbi:hypothetical protein Ancab_004791 [Ancistrocladus abbreviatus]